MHKTLFFLMLFSFYFNEIIAQNKTIGIFAYKTHLTKPWDPDSVKSGIAGSEEAIIYVSEKLVKLGYNVIVYAHPPVGSSYSTPYANPRYVDIDKDDGSYVDIAISWRQPYLSEYLKRRAGKVYLWPHDTYHEVVPQNQINAFNDVLWLSEWQRQYWASINPGFAKFTKIIGNGINVEDFKPITNKKNPYSCIYGSNYARGLEVLLDNWPLVKSLFPQATLDIYYGWEHWGLLSKETEIKMRNQIINYFHLGVVDHGCVGHDELNRAYEKASLWTYPCISWEVFCITALKAQYAGAIPVIIDGTALPDTAPHGYRCQDGRDYLFTLIQAMSEVENISLDDRKAMRTFIDEKYTWGQVARKWRDIFEN